MIDTDSAWMIQQHESWNLRTFERMPKIPAPRYTFTATQLAIAVRSAEIRQEMKESK